MSLKLCETGNKTQSGCTKMIKFSGFKYCEMYKCNFESFYVVKKLNYISRKNVLFFTPQKKFDSITLIIDRYKS
jgi:hypothetical protein